MFTLAFYCIEVNPDIINSDVSVICGANARLENQLKAQYYNGNTVVIVFRQGHRSYEKQSMRLRWLASALMCAYAFMMDHSENCSFTIKPMTAST